MPKRGQKGRFMPEEKKDEVFLLEVKGFIALLYHFWRYIPLFIILCLLWKYFSLTSKIFDILIESLCGAGCKCSCPTKKNED